MKSSLQTGVIKGSNQNWIYFTIHKNSMTIFEREGEQLTYPNREQLPKAVIDILSDYDYLVIYETL